VSGVVQMVSSRALMHKISGVDFCPGYLTM
jgi:hypothetical protein